MEEQREERKTMVRCKRALALCDSCSGLNGQRTSIEWKTRERRGFFFPIRSYVLRILGNNVEVAKRNGHGFTKFILDSETKRGRRYLGKIKSTTNDESRLKSDS